MDPDAALKAMDAAWSARDRVTVGEHAEALLEWVSRAGFMPAFSAGDWRRHLSRRSLIGYLRDLANLADMDDVDDVSVANTCDDCGQRHAGECE